MSLALRDIGVRFGPVAAVQGVSLDVPEGKIVSVIGPNGAGKTSLLNAVMGLTPHSGEIAIAGRALGRAPAHKRARAGIGYVVGGQSVFRTMSIKDNVRLGADTAEFPRIWDQLCGWFPLLAQRHASLGAALSGGQQQIVGIARAMAARPKFLLMDEPSMGLSPIAIGQVVEALEHLTAQGIGVLLAEQNAALAMRVSSYCSLLVRGEKRLEGEPRDIEGRAEVRALYLGETL